MTKSKDSLKKPSTFKLKEMIIPDYPLPIPNPDIHPLPKPKPIKPKPTKP